MRKRLLISVLSVLPLLAVAGYAAAGGQSGLAEARKGTAAFHDLEQAKAAGYDFELPDVHQQTCIANLTNPSAEAMGVHMVNLGLLDDPSTPVALDDTTLDPAVPEVLVYERRDDGTLKLVAVEYVVFKAAWEAEHGAAADRPSLFGIEFEPNTGARYGLPPFYALHAWIWKPNPTDMFFGWNPRVTCD